MCTSPVVTRVSTATRAAGSCSSRASRIASETWSQTLSGCPSVTDSEVKRRMSGSGMQRILDPARVGTKPVSTPPPLPRVTGSSYPGAMAIVHELSRAEARRVAVRAQLLEAHRPDDMLEVLRRLTLVQLDPIAAIAPSADLVLWSRLGASYEPAQRFDAIESGELIELRGLVRPAEDIALYRTEMEQWPGGADAPGYLRAQADWVAANDACRRAILEILRGDGPLPSSELPDLCEVPWRSSGWNNNKNL